MNDELYKQQIEGLDYQHFLVLYWTMVAEDKREGYNITNVFDDLKLSGVTRTKQSAVSYVETLKYLQFIELREQRNRKSLYLTEHGAKALMRLGEKFDILKSNYLETVK